MIESVRWVNFGEGVRWVVDHGMPFDSLPLSTPQDVISKQTYALRDFLTALIWIHFPLRFWRAAVGFVITVQTPHLLNAR
jgi:hypothetical protein